jgi:hypothetical protein
MDPLRLLRSSEHFRDQSILNPDLAGPNALANIHLHVRW